MAMLLSQQLGMEELEGDAVVRVTKNSRAGLTSWLDKAAKGATLEGAVDIAASWEAPAAAVATDPDNQRTASEFTTHDGSAQQQQQLDAQAVFQQALQLAASLQLSTDDASVPRQQTDGLDLGSLMQLLLNSDSLSQLATKFGGQGFQQPPPQQAQPSAAASNATRDTDGSTGNWDAAATGQISPEALLDTPFAHCQDMPFGDCTSDAHAGKDPSSSAMDTSVAALGSVAGSAMPSMDWRTMSYPPVYQPDDRCRTPSPRQQGDGSFSPPRSAPAATGQGSRSNVRPSPPAMQSSSKKPDVAADPVTPTRCLSPAPRPAPQHLPQGKRKLQYNVLPTERHAMPPGRVMAYPHAPPYMPVHYPAPHHLHHPQYSAPHPPFQPPPHLQRPPSRFARLNTGDAAAAPMDDGAAPTPAAAPTAGTSRRSSASTAEALGAVSGPQRVASDSSCDASSGHAPRPGTSTRPPPQFFGPQTMQPGYYYPRHQYLPYPLPHHLQRPGPTRANSCTAERDGGMPSMSGRGQAPREDLRASAPESMRAHAAHPQQQQQRSRQPPLTQQQHKRSLADRDRLAPSHSAPPGALQCIPGMPWMVPAGGRPVSSQDMRWYMHESMMHHEAKKQMEKEKVILQEAMQRFQDEDEAGPIEMPGPMARDLAEELLRIRSRLERRARRAMQEPSASVGHKVGETEVIDAAMLGKLSAAYAAQPGEENREKAQTAALAAAALASAERAERQLPPPTCHPGHPAERVLTGAANAPAPRSPKRRVLQHCSSTGTVTTQPCGPTIDQTADESTEEIEMFLDFLIHNEVYPTSS